MKVKICTAAALSFVLSSGQAFADGADNCADAVETPAGTYTFDLTTATPSGVANSCGFNSTTSADVWFKHTPAVSGTMTVSDCGLASFDTVLSAFDGCNGAQLACQDDGCNLQSTITFQVTAGQAVLIRVCGYNQAIGSGSITITAPTPPPPGTLLESGDAGDVPATAQQATGDTGNLPTIVGTLGASDADMYLIQICEPANFSASTVNPDTGVADTQLFLFDENGMGIVMDDDDPSGSGLHSVISSAFTSSLAAGNYLLAVSQYNKDPLNASGAIIWENQPFDVERAPDSLTSGGDNVVASWDANGGTGGAYHINLTGACYVGATSNCVADLDNGSGTGVQDGAVTIEDLLYFLVQFEAGSSHADVDNGTSTGTTDGAVTIEDLLYFLLRFEAGC